MSWSTPMFLCWKVHAKTGASLAWTARLEDEKQLKPKAIGKLHCFKDITESSCQWYHTR